MRSTPAILNSKSFPKIPILYHIIPPSLTRSSYLSLTISSHPWPDQIIPPIQINPPSGKSRLIFFRNQTIQTRHKWRFGILAGIKWYIYLFQEKKNWTKSYWREKRYSLEKSEGKSFGDKTNRPDSRFRVDGAASMILHQFGSEKDRLVFSLVLFHLPLPRI